MTQTTAASMAMSEPERTRLVRRGKQLEYFTVGYNSLEGIIAVIAGLFVGSIALVGFGFDSGIEVLSGLLLLWRLHGDTDVDRREAGSTGRVSNRRARWRGVINTGRDSNFPAVRASLVSGCPLAQLL